jgi:hypothetical protein
LRLRLPLSFIVVVSALLLLAGCAKEPNPVGAKLLPGSDLLQVDTVTFVATRCYSSSNITATSASARVLVGTVGTIQSWGIYRFSYLPDSTAAMPFVSAELTLRTLYHFGDSLAPFSFTVHRILQNWATDSLTIDSLKAPGFYETKPCGTWSEGSLGDTVTISVPLDTSAIRAWGTASDTLVTNLGLLLQPTNSGVIKGFGSFTTSGDDMQPRLLLRFRDVAGNIDTLINKLGTHRYVVTGMDPTWQSDSTRLHVMNGGSYRGYVEFNVKSLPAHAAVHKAILELTPDPRLMQLNYFTVDSLEMFFTADDGTTVEYVSASGGPVQAGASKVYNAPVGSFVQRWLRGAAHQRIVIAGFTESQSLDLFTFYGMTADTSYRPKLKVFYSLIQ